MNRIPLRLRVTQIKTNEEASKVISLILSEFPLAASDQSDHESIIKDFNLQLDENLRKKY